MPWTTARASANTVSDRGGMTHRGSLGHRLIDGDEQSASPQSATSNVDDAVDLASSLFDDELSIGIGLQRAAYVTPAKLPRGVGHDATSMISSS